MKPATPLDLAKLERDLHHTPLPPAPTVEDFAPRRMQASETALQIIAQGITHLTWKEAEAMGSAIMAESKDGVSLTAAIQAWAEKWESFK